ncbi:Leucine-rich repeat-containing G-protein coupled receptor 4 [Varanus komodoensis]|nr:Leucine-rich repeat-containing G-protein coupled receptor 4 [Varanus komodoensis]
MRCLALLGFFAWGFGSLAGPNGGASPPPCPASCSCDGDGGVDCSGRGLTAVPEGLSAFTHLLPVAMAASLLFEMGEGIKFAVINQHGLSAEKMWYRSIKQGEKENFEFNQH